MHWKNKVLKTITISIVLFLFLNPELIELAIFIDMVGIEMYLFLLEAQVLAIYAVFLNKLLPLKLVSYSWNRLKFDSSKLLFIVPSQATLMHSIVCVSIISMFIL